MKDENDKYYSKYIKKLKELHEDYPSLAEEEACIGLERLGMRVEKKRGYIHTHLFGDVEIKKLILIIIFIIIGLLGLFTIEKGAMENGSIMLYYFGLIFFIAGFLVGTSKDGKGAGIIFLFSHGMTGYAMMIGSLIGPTLSTPAISDTGEYLSLYLALGVLVIIIGIISSIIYNLSDKLKAKQRYPIIPLSIFALALVMGVIFPYIIKFL